MARNVQQRPDWDARRVRALRRYMACTQGEQAQDLGVRQQTASEWETGLYRPRGASRAMLILVAERARFPYQASSQEPEQDASS